MNIIFVIVKCFDYVICHITGTLSMKSVIEFNKTAVNKPLLFKTHSEL